MSPTNNPPGLMLPTQKSYNPGAGNPRDSAMMSVQNMNIKQASLTASVGGGRKRHKFRGGAAAISVPQIQMQYQPQGGPGSNPNDQIKANSSTSMQSAAWASKDNEATNVTPTAKVGGSRRSSRRSSRRRNYKGGSSKYNWGCYSGGKRKTYRKSRKNHRKKSRCHSHH